MFVVVIVVVVQADWERVRPKLDHNFVFAEYLKHLMHETICSMVELKGSTWFVIWLIFVPLW